jgi:WW domain
MQTREVVYRKKVWRVIPSSSGRPYFHNRLTQQTQWTRPSDAQLELYFSEVAREPLEPAERVDSPTPLSPAAKDAASPVQTSSANDMPPAPPASASPTSDWREGFDGSSGKKYWYNSATKQTSWAMPTEFASPEESEDLQLRDAASSPSASSSPKAPVLQSSKNYAGVSLFCGVCTIQR